MNAYLFDVDGVLSNLRHEINHELIAKLSEMLIQGEQIGLISGRAFEWQIDHVVKPIEQYLAEKDSENSRLVDNLFVSGEFGGVSVLHENGQRITNIDSNVALPDDLRKKLQAAAKPYEEYILTEVEKQTMFSSPRRPHVDLELFAKLKPEIIEKYKIIMHDYPDFGIHQDRFSINVKHTKANKRYATAEVIEWLSGKKLTPDHYFAFGDSISDLEIGEELFERNLLFEFVFVGREEELKGHTVRFPLIITEGDFDVGTLEYLTK